jgi:uncharacterized integral membrane protein
VEPEDPDVAREPVERVEPAEAPAEPVVAGAPPPQPRVERTGTGVMPAVVIGIVLAAAVIAFIAQNTKRVDLKWLWIDFRTTPGVLALIALFLGVVAAVVIGAAIRRNRRTRLNEREELARLRARQAST